VGTCWRRCQLHLDARAGVNASQFGGTCLQAVAPRGCSLRAATRRVGALPHLPLAICSLERDTWLAVFARWMRACLGDERSVSRCRRRRSAPLAFGYLTLNVDDVGGSSGGRLLPLAGELRGGVFINLRGLACRPHAMNARARGVEGRRRRELRWTAGGFVGAVAVPYC